jgi:eukaryotic-like serine/threonine-protein kinase
LKKLGKYEVLGELGRGAMGVVYRARDPVINRLVALKTITTGLADPNLLQRFYREAQSAGGLQHPNIVTIYDMGDEQNLPYIAMELIEGESLEQIIARREELPIVLKLTYALQACRAFDYAHKRGIVHRDIKPGNVMVNKEGVLKVVDFGIARVLDTSKTQTGMLIGTFAYMSPEQYHGEHADERSDIWSFGVLLYELLCYQRPFTGDNPASLMHSICRQEHRPLRELVSDCPPEIDLVLSKILRKSPEDRCQSMEDLLLDLEPVYKELQSRSIAGLIDRSRQLIDDGGFAEARELLREALKVDSANASARAMLEKANVELKRLLIRPRTLQYVEKGSALLEEGKIQEAKAEVESALQLDSNFEPAQQLLKRVQQELDRAELVAEWLQSCRQRLAEGMPDDAETFLTKVLELDPSNKQAIKLQQQAQNEKAERQRRLRLLEKMQEARSLWTQQKYEDSIALLTALQEEFPSEDEIQRLLETVQDDQAEQYRQNALGRIRDFLASGNYVECSTLLAALQRRFPNDEETSQLKEEVRATEAKQRRVERLTEARGRLASGHYRESITLLKSLEREFPDDQEITQLLGRVQEDQAEQQRQQGLAEVRNRLASRRYEDCRSLLDKLQKQFPNDDEIPRLLNEVREDEAEQRKLTNLAGIRNLLTARRYEQSIALLTELQREFGLDEEISRLLSTASEGYAEQQRQQSVAEVRNLLAARRYEECNTLLATLRKRFPNDDEIPELLNAVREDEARQRKLKSLAEAQNLIASRHYVESITLLTALQKEFPNEPEIPKLLTNAGKEQAEQQKQQKLAECRVLLAAQEFKKALDLLDTLRDAHPKDSAIQKLRALAEREADKQSRAQRLLLEINELKKFVNEKKYSAILSRSETLQAEFPDNADLLRLIDFARSQQSQIESETRLRNLIDEVKAHFAANRFSEAINAANAGLKAFPQNPELIHLRELAEPEEKKQRNRGLIERQIREIKFKINRQNFSDAVDLAQKTLATTGPNTELTQLLNSALFELQTRDKKRGQEQKLQQIRTLLHSGNIEEAGKTLHDALAAETLDGFDLRVTRISQEIEGARSKSGTESSTPATSKPASFSNEYAFMQGAPAEEPPVAESPGTREAPVSQASSSPTVSTPQPLAPAPPPKFIQSAPTSTPPVVVPGASQESIARPPADLPSSAKLAKPPVEPAVPDIIQRYRPSTSDVAERQISTAPTPNLKKPAIIGASALGLILAIWAGVHFSSNRKPEPTHPGIPAISNELATSPAPSPLNPPVNPLEAKQRTAIDTADSLIISGDLQGALGILQEAGKLNGPLTAEIKKKEAGLSESMRDEVLAKHRQQEAILWQQAMNDMQRLDFESAKVNLRKIVSSDEGGVRRADAQHFLDNVIPRRQKEEALFRQATQISKASDLQSLQRAYDLFGQVEALDGPRKANAADLQRNIEAQVIALKQENTARQISDLEASARQRIQQGDLKEARQKIDQIRQAGGDPTALSREIDQAEATQARLAKQQTEFRQAVESYNAVGNRDRSGLEKSRSDFQAIVRQNTAQAGDAQQYLGEIDRKLDALNAPPPLPTPAVKRDVPNTVITDEATIRDVIRRFFQAFEQRNPEGLSQVWPTIPQKRYDGWKNAFASASAITMQIASETVNLSPNGETAIVSVQSQQVYTPKVEKTSKKSAASWKFQLAKKSGGWVITDVQ